MDKKRILHETKNGMTQTIEKLDLINVEEIKKTLIRYLEFVEMLQKLPEIETRTTDTVVQAEVAVAYEVTEQVSVEEKNEGLPERELVQEEVEDRKVYRFERKLKGGLLVGLTDSPMVPEKIVRLLNIEHGDQVEIIDTKQSESGESRHMYAIAEKGNGIPHPDRVEELYCLVEKDSYLGYIVRQDYLGNNLCVGDNPFTFILKQNDVQDLQIRENDLIDIAYYRNSPTSVRIVWKHDTTEIEEAKQIRSIKKQLEKKAIEEEKPKGYIPSNQESFKGKTILVIGAKPKESNYRDMLKEYEADIRVLTGYEAKSMIRSNTKNADVVIINIAHCGHSTSQKVVEMCKQFKKPFEIVDSMGNESFMRGVEKALQQEMESGSRAFQATSYRDMMK